MPELHSFPEPQAEEIRQEVRYFLRPFVRRVTIVTVTVIVFMVIGAAVGVYFYGRQANDFTEKVCLTSKHIRDPLTTYIATAVRIQSKERALHLPVFADPRLKPLLREQSDAIRRLLHTLEIAQHQSCSANT